MKTPVALIIFNRPDLTRKVLEKIAEAKPERLFIISDGPRKTKVGEELLVQETREIVKDISWNCTVEYKYADSNLGCRNSVASGLDWVFAHVDRAIILEDDCIPNPSFFPYCEELLEKYKNTERVSMISGDNFFYDDKSIFSYNFSRHSLIWGWATWKRTWDCYRLAEKNGVEFFESHYVELLKKMNLTRLQSIKKTLLGQIDTWDYILQYAMLISDGLCIYPENNLIKNIGFDANATHTKRPTFHSKLRAEEIIFPLRHPADIKPNEIFEKQMENTYNRLYIFFDLLKQFFRL